MTRDEIKLRFPNTSASVLALADSPIQPTKPAKQKAPLASNHEGETQGTGCPLVSFTLRRVRLLDVDAKYGVIKDLLDGLCYAGIIYGDKEGQISLEVRQEKVGSFKEENTLIEIFTP